MQGSLNLVFPESPSNHFENFLLHVRAKKNGAMSSFDIDGALSKFLPRCFGAKN